MCVWRMLGTMKRFPFLPVSVTSSPLSDLCFLFSSLSAGCLSSTQVLAHTESTERLNRLEDDTLRQAATSSAQSESSDPPCPSPSPSLPLSLWGKWFVSQLLLLLHLGGVFIFFLFFFLFLVEMSLGSCPPALKKTLPALLLLSSVLLHCLIFHPFCLKRLAATPPTGSST